MARQGKLLIEDNRLLGVYQTALFESDLVRVGAAFVDLVRRRTCPADRFPPRVVIGFDARPSSWELQNALVRGIASRESNVVHLGLSPSPLVLFSMNQLKMDGAVIIGGGGRPTEWNGAHFYLEGRALRADDTRDLLRRAARVPEAPVLPMHGRITYLNMIPDYLRRMEKEFGGSMGAGIRVVAAGNHGAASLIAPHALLRSGCAVLKLGCVLGVHAEHARSDPADPSTIRDLGSAVRGFNADFGVAFDGAGERIAVVDRAGLPIPGDHLLALFADDLWGRSPGSPVACDLANGDLLEECLDRRAGSIRFVPPGPSSMDKAIRTDGALLAAESGGRFFFADRHPGYPDGVYAALRLVELLARIRAERGDRVPLGKILPRGERFLSPEKIVEFSAGRAFLDKFADRLREREEKGEPILSIREDHCSAVRVRCPEGWGVLRLRRGERTLGLRYGGGTDEGFQRAGRLLRGALRDTLEEAGWQRSAGEDARAGDSVETVPAGVGEENPQENTVTPALDV
ncbi:MAG: hypothetical protein JW958_11695 [Candidatus Eisenbacteria bacterium]|nr:hypothetical protein [Candidatus Eisenbacteria bacterium]